MMKKTLNLSLAALGIMAGGLLSSCSQEDMPSVNNSGNVLVKAPKIVATSGETILGDNTYGTRAGESVSEKPAHITADEMKAVREKLNAVDTHFIGNYSGEVEGVHLFNGFYDFNTQWLKDGSDFYVVNVVNGEGGQMSNMDVRFWHEIIAYDISEDTYNNGDFTTLGYADLFLNYEQYNPQIHIEKEIEDISFNDYKYFIFGTNPLYNGGDKNDYNKAGHYPPFRYLTIEGLEGDGNWEYAYIACYWQQSAEYSPNSPSTEKGDNKWDRVIRIAKRKACTDCPHPDHGSSVCASCAFGSVCNPNLFDGDDGIFNDDPETPDVPDVTVPGHNHGSEVEVNLHGVERNGGYLESHLSLHLRHAGDVEVFIPVPTAYTCEADDLDIVMKHEANHMTHNASFTLKDSASSPYGELTVSITVAYEDDGIRITTHGVTEEVIAWCREKCDGDGITFEIWNYYNDPEKLGENLGISYDDLLYLLNKATIRFLGDELPETYINSFGKDADVSEYGRDCTVTIVEDQVGSYKDGTPGPHLNGSDANMVYERK